MTQDIFRNYQNYMIRRKRRSVLKKVVSVLACIVIFCTTYALILPAITLEKETFCGKTEHIHSEKCYGTLTETYLACTIEAQRIHTHSDACYTRNKTELICTLEETEGHTHGDGCLISGTELICGTEENHIHASSCYTYPVVCKITDDTHVHEALCYGTEGQLICEIPEGHIHTDACYNTVVNCGLEEISGHSHHDDCWSWETVMTCGLEEGQAEPDAAAHIHGDECFAAAEPQAIPICGNIDAGHTHVPECYELTCGLQPHTHELSCYSNPNADVESRKDWEATFAKVRLTGNWNEDVLAIAKTQLGYTESTKNYLVREDETLQGYTRYGQWYGDLYGDWCAMFVSFCVDYAEVEGMPLHKNVRAWIEDLKILKLYHDSAVYEASAGDLIFYDLNRDGNADHMGLVSQITPATDVQHAQLQVIEGNSSDRVQYVVYDAADSRILGYGELPDNPQLHICGIQRHIHNEYCRDYEGNLICTAQEHRHTEACDAVDEEVQEFQITQSAETANYIVTVTYSSLLQLPDGAELRVIEHDTNSEIFRQRCEEAGKEFEWLLNIGFFQGEEELKLTGEFHVVVANKQGEVLTGNVTHFADSGAEELEAVPVIDGTEEGRSALGFTSAGFSDFGGTLDNDITTVADGQISGNTLTMKVTKSNTLNAESKYIIYTQGPYDTIIFLNANSNGGIGNCSTATISVNGKPFTANATWTTTDNAVLAANGNNYGYLWTAEYDENDNLRLRSRYGHYLTVSNGIASTQTDASSLTISNTGNWFSTVTKNISDLVISDTTSVYIAEVTYETQYPDCVKTGDVSLNMQHIYNLCEKQDGNINVLAGCIFEIVALDKHHNPAPETYQTYVTSGSDMTILLPSDQSDGNYMMTEVSVPEGYIGDVNPVRYFRIDGDSIEFYGEYPSGLFINHQDSAITSSKLASVEDYNNRTYQMVMRAQSKLHSYSMNPVDVLFVVDQSNSMLYPSAMDPVFVADRDDTVAEVTLYKDDGKENIRQLEELRANGTLDEGTLYYIVADPEGSATAWALWYDGYTWLIQDAAYYAKAKMENAAGYNQPDEIAVFPISGMPFRTDSIELGDGTYEKANGGDLSYSPEGSLGAHIVNSVTEVNSDGETVGVGTEYTYSIFTAREEHNRLHYLEQAVADSICQLASMNPENAVAMVKFARTVNETVPFTSLSTENLPGLLAEVNKVNTFDGSRPDRALITASVMLENRTNSDAGNDRARYTVLLTDGAPVITADDNGTVRDVYAAISTNAESVRNRSTLFTVALNLDEAQTGSEKLEQIASYKGSSKHCYPYSASAEAKDAVVFANLKNAQSISNTGAHALDVISHSFYPIAWSTDEVKDRQFLYSGNGRNWYLLEVGDWITLEGEYYGTAEPYGESGYGQLRSGQNHSHGSHCYTSVRNQNTGKYENSQTCTIAADDLYIQWDHLHGLETAAGWTGTVYVKAREDFIGGNAIHTDTEACIAIGSSATYFDKPTVNVRLLDMNQNSSEVTVFLGEMVNSTDESAMASPIGTLQDFFAKTRFTKLIPDFEGNYSLLMNAVDAAIADDGLEGDAFYLNYAMGGLTDQQWVSLINGNDVIVEYTYDDNGPVGYFTFRLTKTGGASDFAAHKSTESCEKQNPHDDCNVPAEAYTLHVTYTAYRLGAGSVITGNTARPSANVHNGQPGPGIEVGSVTYGGLTDGYGIVDKDNIHRVHVISGEITIINEIEDSLLDYENPQTYTFSVNLDGQPYITVAVEIPAGERTAAVTLTNLPRGTYTIAEEINDTFSMKSLTIQDDTNCASDYIYTSEDQSIIAGATFSIGYDAAFGNDVNAVSLMALDLDEDMDEAVNADPAESSEAVYGEILVVNTAPVYSGEVHVWVTWEDNGADHSADSVYVVLYEVFNAGTDQEEYKLVMADAEHAKILELNTDTNWMGTFTVTLNGADDDISNHTYAIREVSLARENEVGTLAYLKNSNTEIRFKDPVADGDTIIIQEIGYLIEYAVENGTLGVINHLGRVMPESGGVGIHVFAISGLLLLATALIYAYILQRRKKV